MKIVLKTSFNEIVEKDWKYIEKYSSSLIFQSYEWNYNWYKCNNFKKKLDQINQIMFNKNFELIYDKKIFLTSFLTNLAAHDLIYVKKNYFN